MRHLLIFAAILALLAGTYYWARGRTISINGRVLVHDVDGREVAVSGAKASWYPAGVVDQHLRDWLDSYEEWQRANELRLRAARNEWNQKVAARDEAAGILRVAERTNAADLAICRARHREAAADAEDALRKLEKLNSGADEAADPARFLAGLPAPPVEFVADADGRFSVQSPQGESGYIFASVERSGQRKESLVWLRVVDPEESEAAQFSNANVLTADSLARLAREIKNREAPAGPLDSSSN